MVLQCAASSPLQRHQIEAVTADARDVTRALNPSGPDLVQIHEVIRGRGRMTAFTLRQFPGPHRDARDVECACKCARVLQHEARADQAQCELARDPPAAFVLWIVMPMVGGEA